MKHSIEALIEGKKYIIDPPVGNTAHYKVVQDKFLLGYLSNLEINEFTNQPIWKGTSLELSEVAKELGAVIDNEI